MEHHYAGLPASPHWLKRDSPPPASGAPDPPEEADKPQSDGQSRQPTSTGQATPYPVVTVRVSGHHPSTGCREWSQHRLPSRPGFGCAEEAQSKGGHSQLAGPFRGGNKRRRTNASTSSRVEPADLRSCCRWPGSQSEAPLRAGGSDADAPLFETYAHH